MASFEDSFKSKDNTMLYWQGRKAAGDVRGVVCLVHGIGEHSNRYQHMAEFFARKGFHFSAFDLRGHGKSEGIRGDAPSYAALMDDIQSFLDYSGKKFPSLPVFIYGHSLGGNLVLNFLLRRHPAVKGVIISAPALGLAYDPPKVKMLVGRVLSKVLPTLAIASDLDTSALSRDVAVVQAYVQDPLVHDRVTGRMAFGFMDAGDWALAHAEQLDTPTLLMHGSADKLTSLQASRRFAKKAGDICEFVLWEGFFHELHNEIGKEDVFEYVLNWMNTLSGNKGRASK